MCFFLFLFFDFVFYSPLKYLLRTFSSTDFFDEGKQVFFGLQGVILEMDYRLWVFLQTLQWLFFCLFVCLGVGRGNSMVVVLSYQVFLGYV